MGLDEELTERQRERKVKSQEKCAKDFVGGRRVDLGLASGL